MSAKSDYDRKLTTVSGRFALYSTENGRPAVSILRIDSFQRRAACGFDGLRRSRIGAKISGGDCTDFDDYFGHAACGDFDDFMGLRFAKKIIVTKGQNL